MAIQKKTMGYEPVAVIGYGCTYAGSAKNKKEFWNLIVSGDIGVSVMQEERVKWKNYYSTDKAAADKTYSLLQGLCEYPGILDKKYQEKLNTNGLNRTQIMSLNTIISAFEGTNYNVTELVGRNIGCYMGNMLGDDCYNEFCLQYHRDEIKTYLEFCPEFMELDKEVQEKITRELLKKKEELLSKIDDSTVERYINSLLPVGIKKALKIKGPAAIIDGACASSIYALDEAIKILHESDLEMCIVTGALGSVNVIGSIGFAKTGGLSDEVSRPMDHDAKGLNASEGFGTILIKPLGKAIEDKDAIFGVITGIGTSNDGHGKSIYAPNRKGQTKCMKRALEKANLEPGQIDYIELHATGTPIGDQEEFESLKNLFEGCSRNKGKLPLGCVKSQLGHSFSAAGIAGIIKVLESFAHKELPPTWGFSKVKPEWRIEETIFYINTEKKKWKIEDTHYRAMVNAFGFGGCNGSVVLEEYVADGNYGSGYKSKKDVACDIAITGLGVMKPELIEECPEKRWNVQYAETYKKEIGKAGFINLFSFPFLKYKIPPIVLAQVDRAQQIALLTASEAIEDYGKERIKDKHVSVYVGKNMNTEQASKLTTSVRYIEYFDDISELTEFSGINEDKKERIMQHINKCIRSCTPPLTEDALPGYMDSIVAARISNYFDFDCSSIVVDGWTNAFSIALKQAVAGLKAGDADLSVVGGIHANMTPEFLYLWDQVKPDTPKKNPAEGCVFFVLKRYEDVTEEDKVYARIRDIYSESIEEGIKGKDNSLVYDKKLEYEYFGADMAFRIVDGIQKLKNGSKEVKFLHIKEPAWFYDAYSVCLSKENVEV